MKDTRIHKDSILKEYLVSSSNLSNIFHWHYILEWTLETVVLPMVRATYGLKLEQVLHVHHSFAVAGWKQWVVLAIDDWHQVPQVTAASWRLAYDKGHTAGFINTHTHKHTHADTPQQHAHSHKENNLQLYASTATKCVPHWLWKMKAVTPWCQPDDTNVCLCFSVLLLVWRPHREQWNNTFYDSLESQFFKVWFKVLIHKKIYYGFKNKNNSSLRPLFGAQVALTCQWVSQGLESLL